MGKTYVYDEFDRPILISVHPVGTADMLDTHYEYDENGNMVREIDTLGHATAYAYD